MEISQPDLVEWMFLFAVISAVIGFVATLANWAVPLMLFVFLTLGFVSLGWLFA